MDIGTTGFNDDEIILDNDSTLDLSNSVLPIEETTETIGDVQVDLVQQVEFVATEGDFVTLKNTDLPTATVQIPDETKVSAPAEWDQTIAPPKIVATGGTVQSGFLTPTLSISVGSPDVILVFDTPVTLILEGTSGTTAYKTPGTTEWIIISTCTGSFQSPGNPPVNGECSISDGTDTKIITYHFTEFTSLSTPSDATESSSGHGQTGVGSPRIFGPSSSGSSGSSGGGYIPGDTTLQVLPAWFDSVKDWYREGKISALEFLNAYQWILENILR